MSPGIHPALLASSGGVWEGSGGGDWGDGKSFGNRSEQTSIIVIDGEDGTVIDDLFFDGVANSVFQYDSGEPGNSHVCIRILNSTNITVRNCDFLELSEPIEVYNSDVVLVEYSRADGITGPAERVGQQTGNFLQTHGGSTFVTVANNKIIAIGSYDPWAGAHQLGTEDVISLFGASNCVAEYNAIDATGYTRDFGTGTILGDGFGDDNVIRYNTYLNPGQVGIAVAGGHRNELIGNIIYRAAGQRLGAGNTAAYYWDYNEDGMSGGLIQDNRAKWYEGGGLWNPGPPPATVIDNDWDDDTIDPADLVVTM